MPSTCKIEVQKKKKKKKMSVRLTVVSFESEGRGAYYDAPCVTTVRKLLFDKRDAYNLDTG